MMDSSQIEGAAQSLREAQDHAALKLALARIADGLGFRFFSLVRTSPTSRLAVRLSNFPERWHTELGNPSFWLDSELGRAVYDSVAPFAWSDLWARVRPSRRDLRILALARSEGIGDGFMLAVRTPSQALGFVAFAVGIEDDLDREQFSHAHYLGLVALETSWRLSRAGQPPPLLSKRQSECVTLVARGKSDWEIGAVLGISRETAHKHIVSAMQRLDVSTRAQLVARALQTAHIRIEDISER